MEYDAAMRFAQDVAGRYDEWHSPPPDETLTAIRFIEDRVGPAGTVVEYGVGTGRIAIPLAVKGYTVCGIDSSPEMLAELAKKDPTGLVTVLNDDMSTVQLERKFGLAVCIFNTLHCAPDQDSQVAFFRNASRHLLPDGRLIVETEIIGLQDFSRNKRITPVAVANGYAALAVMLHDPCGQMLARQNIEFRGSGISLTLNQIRYTWPAELDLMARLAGLSLLERFGGWGGENFAGDGYCVSVYQKPGS
jgi:SAM-dependent methyltransferase